MPGRVQQQPGVPFFRTVYAEGDFGTGSFTPTVSILVEPFRGAPISPRGRVGLGRMLGHGEAVRSLGGGVRYGFGAHALTMDVDWWTLALDVVRETVVLPLSGGPEQVLMRQPFGSDHDMFLVRVGWSMRL